MQLSCTENPPPYGLRVKITYLGNSNPVSIPYVRRRKQGGINNGYIDFWTITNHSPGTMQHSVVDLKNYTWELPDELCDNYEIFEDE